MKPLKITETFANTAALVESGLLEKWFSNFGMTHVMMEKVKRMDSYKATYYIVSAEPLHNYGLDFNIYVKYTADGINFFKQLCITSAITSNALRQVLIDGDRVVFGNRGYAKDDKARPALRRASQVDGWIFA